MIHILFADMISDTARDFGVDWPHLIAQIISFLIVSGALVVLAYKPILTVLDERKKRIAESLANAEKIKHELARTEAARQEVLNQANLQANKLIEEARAAAARVQEQETQKAIAAAEPIITKAREAAAQDHARVVAELQREARRLVAGRPARVSGKVLTSEDQRRLSEETNRQLAA